MRLRSVRPFLLLTCLGLVACDGSGSDGPVASEATAEDEGESSDDGVADTEGERPLRIAVPAVVETADHAVYQGRTTSDVVPNWGSPLITWTLPEPDATTLLGPSDVQGWLAESFEQNEEGNLILQLREAVSEHGNPLTPEDVVWSFERVQALDPIGGFLLAVGGLAAEETVRIIDERTVEVRVDRPGALNLPVLAAWPMTILDSTAVREHMSDEDPWGSEWLASNSATFGPYRLDSIEPGQEVRLVRNENFWGDPAPYPDVVIRGVPDLSSRFQLISSGEIEFAEHLSLDHLTALEQEAEVVPLAALSSNIDGMFLNHQFEPFADPRVRRAIGMAIDREATLQGPYQGFGRPATLMISSATPQPPPPDEIAHDPDAARQLLNEAGYESLAFTLNVEATRGGVEELAILVASQLREVGLEVAINVVSSTAEYQAAIDEGSMEAYIGVNRPLVNDPGYLFALLHDSAGITNKHGYANARVDELTAAILASNVGADRDALIDEAHRLLLEDMPWIPLVETVEAHAIRGNVCGYRIYPDTHTKIWQLHPQGDAGSCS